MKILNLLVIIFFAISTNSYSQNGREKQPSFEEVFEIGIPLYLMNNLCKNSGLTDLARALSADDRVTNIEKDSEKTNIYDYLMIIYYNGNVIEIPSHNNSSKYSSFNVHFRNKSDAQFFGKLLAGYLDYKVDSDNENKYNSTNPFSWIQVNLDDQTSSFFVSAYFLNC